jgi:hypothetical protein
MAKFSCQQFVVLGFNPNDYTDQSFGFVASDGVIDNHGREVLRFIHDYESHELIRVLPYSFKPIKNARLLRKGSLFDGTPVFLVALSPTAIYECGGQRFRVQ